MNKQFILAITLTTISVLTIAVIGSAILVTTLEAMKIGKVDTTLLQIVSIGTILLTIFIGHVFDATYRKYKSKVKNPFNLFVPLTILFTIIISLLFYGSYLLIFNS